MLQLNLPETVKKDKTAPVFAEYMHVRETKRPGVPAANNPARTTISFHRHEVVIRKAGPIANILSAIEGSFLVASTVALITLSGTSVVIAASIIGI